MSCLKKQREIQNDVARATVVVGSYTALSRIFGLIRDIAIGHFFGAGYATDAFLVAFRIPNLLRRLVAEGSLSTAFVPIFTRESKESIERGQTAFREILSFVLILTTILAAVGMIFSQELVEIFAPGFSTVSGKSELSAKLLGIMFPYIGIISLTALFSGLLNARNHFSTPALAPVLLNLALIIGAVFSHGLFSTPIESLAWMVLLGGALGLVLTAQQVKFHGFFLSPLSPFGSRAVKNLIFLMIPTILSASLYQVMIFVNSLLASMLREGSVSWLYFAERIVQFPLGVFSIALATAIFPTLSREAARGDKDSLTKHLSNSIRWISFIAIPSSVGLAFLGSEISAVLLERGKMTSHDSQMISDALFALATGLWAISVQNVLVRVYLAEKDSLTPALISCISIAINIYIAVALMGPCNQYDENVLASLVHTAQSNIGLASLGHVGLAWAGTISSFVSMFLSAFCLFRLNLSFPIRESLSGILKSTIAAAIMGIGIYWTKELNLGGKTSELSISLLSGALIYGITCTTLRLEEMNETLKFIAKLMQSKSQNKKNG